MLLVVVVMVVCCCCCWCCCKLLVVVVMLLLLVVFYVIGSGRDGGVLLLLLQTCYSFRFSQNRSDFFLKLREISDFFCSELDRDCSWNFIFWYISSDFVHVNSFFPDTNYESDQSGESVVGAGTVHAGERLLSLRDCAL